MRKHKTGGLAVLTCSALVSAGCATLAPALTNLAMAFAGDLIASASVNYSPRYAVQVEALLAALINDTTGLGVEGQLARTGYRPPPRDYECRQDPAACEGYRDDPRYGGRDVYGEDSGYGDYDDPYGADGAYASGEYDDPYAGANDGYGDSYGSEGAYDDPYTGAGDDYGDPYGFEDDYGEGVDDGPYAGDGSNGDPYGDPYDDPGSDDGPGSTPGNDPGDDGGIIPGHVVATTGFDRRNLPPVTEGAKWVLRGTQPPSIELDATVLARRAGTGRIEALDDGAVLFDGDGDPSRGDLLRFQARANCSCYLYVIGVDATGFVAQIFPDPKHGFSNPIDADRVYQFPAGNDWWGLDDQTGVEHVYFVASMEARPDITDILVELSRAAEGPATTVDLPVRSPAVVPTRGLLRVEAEPVRISANGTNSSVQPDRYSVPGDRRAITVTRWFRHQ